MKYRYVGPHAAVDLDGVGTVTRGEPVDVPAGVAKGLAGQETWEQVQPSRKRGENEGED